MDLAACVNGWDLGPASDAFCMGSVGAIGGGFEGGAKGTIPLLGRNARPAGSRFVSDLPGGRAVAKSIFRALTRNMAVEEEVLKSGTGIRRFAADESVAIRLNADGSTQLDIKLFGVMETIHFR